VALPRLDATGDEKIRAGDEWVMLNEGHSHCRHADDTFHFDNEKPAHRTLGGGRSGWRATSSTNAEWLAFMKDGGYFHADALADGWFCKLSATSNGRHPAIGASSTANGR